MIRCRLGIFHRGSDNEALHLLTVGIKYCGGCNPDYDRVALVEEITAGMRGKARFVKAGCSACSSVAR